MSGVEGVVGTEVKEAMEPMILGTLQTIVQILSSILSEMGNHWRVFSRGK